MVRLVSPAIRVHHQAMQSNHAARHRTVGILGALLLLLTLGASGTAAQSVVTLVPVVSGLDAPVFVTNAGDGSGRLFVVQQGGKIMVVKNGAVLPTPFLDISDLVSTGSEQGLLGLAFHPSYKTNGFFYVNFTRLDGATVIQRYTVSSGNPDVADRSSARKILIVAQPFANHNGGMLAFGKDGYLYIGMGDGGSGGDPGNRAQSIGTMLGKILRIDVNGSVGTRLYKMPPTQSVCRPVGARRDLVARPAQSVALLVRSADRRPVDRRRRAGSVRGGRPLPGPIEWQEPGSRPQLWLAGPGRGSLLQPGDRL